MSGGSMNYLYSRLEYAEFTADTPERRAFAQHLKLVAKEAVATLQSEIDRVEGRK
jgi:hypothetical protein